MASRKFGHLAAACLALSLLAVLASCYIPDRFRGELRLSRFGDFQLDYQGDLIYVPILHDYAEGKIKPEDEAARQETIRQDMARDIAFKKITPMGKGRFQVTYSRGGRLGRDQLVAIVRRDSRILSLKSRPDNQILIVANGIKPSDSDTMGKLGVGLQGEFRVTTDANVIQHNATDVRQFGAYKVYIWKIDNPLSAMPKMVVVRDVDPERPLQ